jgi:hypothetical protein
MNTMTVTQKSSSAGLSDDIKRDAARGPVITPEYVVLTRDAFERLMDDRFDEQLGMIALERSKEPQEGPTLDEVKKEYGL